MQRVHAVEDNAGRARAGECGGYFPADVPRFADADSDDFAAPAERFNDGLDRALEGAVELSAHGFQRGQFDIKHFAGMGEMTHGVEDAGYGGSIQSRFLADRKRPRAARND